MMISLTAVCMAGLFLTITALLALRLYADHNLKLVARAISYTTEAAVVFDDKDAAKDALETITSREDIASASILLPDGQVLASWRRDITTPWTSLEQQLARLILPGPVELSMVRENKEIARVHLVGHGQYLLRFLLQTLMATLVCLLLSGCGGPLVMERVDFENGMVVGDEQVAVDASGRVDSVREDGYIADDRYLKAYEYGDDLGPNAPGYIR